MKKELCEELIVIMTDIWISGAAERSVTAAALYMTDSRGMKNSSAKSTRARRWLMRWSRPSLNGDGVNAVHMAGFSPRI